MHHDGATKSSLGQKTAFALGNLGQSAFYAALSTYFVIYVTEALFINVDKDVATKLIGIITSLIVVVRIAEIFLDPLLGNLIDNTNTKWGRFHPWQFVGGTVSAILLVMIYTGLFGLVNVNTTAFIVCFVIAFVILDVFYSIRDISYWGMIPALSSDSHERSTYTALGSFTGSIGWNGMTVIVVPLVTGFNQLLAGKKEEGPSGWAAFAVIVALLGLLTAWSVVFGTKESTSALRVKEEKAGGPIQAFKAIFSNDQLLWTALSYIFYAIANVATTGVMFYEFKYVLGNTAAYSSVGIIAMIIGFVMAPAFPIVNKVIPRRYLFLGGMALEALAYVLFILGAQNLTLVLVAVAMYYLPQTFIQMTVILCLTDSIEYGQLKTGHRNEAVTLSVRPMLDKLGGAFSNGIVGIIAVAAGMTGNATAADMTTGNISTFKGLAFYMPLALIVIGFFVFMLKVKITEKKHAEIVAELEHKLAGTEEGQEH